MTSKTCVPSSKQRFGISRSRSQSRPMLCVYAIELHRTCEELEETIAFYQKQINVCKEEKAE